MFEVLDGGLRENSETSRKKFIAAYVTNTRLMGVVGVFAIWLLPDNRLRDHMYQFFYLDAEEFGLDTYECIIGPDNDETIDEVNEIKNRLMGGLGGELREISQRELAYIVKEYAEINRKNGAKLPTDNPEFSYILSLESQLSDEEIEALMEKQCEEILSKYHAINYFLMRIFGQDLIAAKYLIKKNTRMSSKINLFRDLKPATLIRNEIDPVTEDYPKNFMCQSLIEIDGEYRLIITEIAVDNQKIADFDRVSDFKISIPEANLITQRGEHISIFEMETSPYDFDRNSTMLTEKSQITDYEAGRLFMVFKPNNEHVNQRIFRLNDDVLGVYFVTDSGQIIIESYTEEGQKRLERDLLTSELSGYLIPLSKYYLTNPILFDFVQSGADDFEEFIQFVSEPAGPKE